MRSRFASLLPAAVLHRMAAFGVTIRGRILIAFLVMSMITAALGGYATFGIKDAATLVDKTYDHSLMSINYARAAATDFASMRAAFARLWIATDPEMRIRLDQEIKTLTKTLHEDLDIAVQRSQSNRAKLAVANVRYAVSGWADMRERLLDRTKLDANWELLDCGASRAFSVSDHQAAHVYVRDSADVAAVQRHATPVPENLGSARKAVAAGVTRPRPPNSKIVLSGRRWVSTSAR